MQCGDPCTLPSSGVGKRAPGVLVAAARRPGAGQLLPAEGAQALCAAQSQASSP